MGSGSREVPLTTPSPTVDSLGISDELKDKLEDVLIPEQQFTLGRMLGKGTRGCAGIGMSGVCHVWVCLVAPITLRVRIWVSSYKQDILIDS